jgi:hypothetical protein
MIEAALRYPLLVDDGRDHYFALTGLLLGTAIALRVARTLFPNALAVLPVGAAILTAAAAVGVCLRAFLTPTEPLPSVRSLIRLGVIGASVSIATLSIPVLFLVWTAISYVDGDVAADSGAAIFFLLGSTIALFGFLLATYVLPVLIARVIETGGVRPALDQRAIGTALSEVPYLQGWTIGIALGLFGWWASVTGVTTTSGAGLFAVVLAGYCLLAGVRAMGIGYGAVPGVETG